MHRIDGPAAAPGGLFTDGDPNVGTPATVVTDDWCNAIQEEIAHVVEGAGTALVKADNSQLLAAIRTLVATALPAGIVSPFGRTTAPPGWLACDGSTVSRGAYPALFAAIGTTWGSGDGSTTFGLPDLRGEFVRGADQGRGIDSGRAIGVWQDWATGRPKTTSPAHLNGNGSTGALVDSGYNPLTGASSVGFVRASNTGQSVTTAGGDAVDAGSQMDVFNACTGDAETRPRNVAMLFCIKV